MIERFPTQVGAHLARIAEESQRLAILARAAVALHQHVSEKAEPVCLERAAQRQQRIERGAVVRHTPSYRRGAQAAPRHRTSRSPRLRVMRRCGGGFVLYLVTPSADMSWAGTFCFRRKYP